MHGVDVQQLILVFRRSLPVAFPGDVQKVRGLQVKSESFARLSIMRSAH